MRETFNQQLGQTIVHCAASRGHIEVLEFIVSDILEEDDDEDEEDNNDPPEEPDADLPNLEDQTKVWKMSLKLILMLNISVFILQIHTIGK